MKRYSKPQAELVFLTAQDILTASVGEEHGMEVPAVTDKDWQIGEIGEIPGA
ncbi:MAG: hypothetical protein IJW16_02790 [Clostridia bacterium]|nr:hypothetical protein [Clostridia bacterium]